MRAEIWDDHKENITRFREMGNLDKTLKKQITDAVPDFYIKRFVNNNTNMITVAVHEVLEHLKTTYGSLSIEEINDRTE